MEHGWNEIHPGTSIVEPYDERVRAVKVAADNRLMLY